MTSPAQRRYNKVVAAQESAAANPGQKLAGSNAYELMLAKLYDDRRRLSDIQSIERKIDVKHEILPEYDDWVAGALAGGRGGQDDVLVTVMVWRMDTGDFDEALKIAEYVLEHDLVLPDQYQRTVPTVIVDEVSQAALQIQKDDHSFPIYLLQKVHELTADSDMPDQARAKLHKALGYEYNASNELELALEHYEIALRLDNRIGVKRQIYGLKKQLANENA